MSIKYFNSKAAIWDENIAEKDSTKLKHLADMLDIHPGASLLDIGTGTGVFVPYLLDKIGTTGRLVCLDFADEMLNKARAKGFKGNIEFYCADIHDSKLPGASFDSIVCYSSFPHFSDKAKALAEIYRMLKPAGRLFICHSSSRQKINSIHCSIEAVKHDMIPADAGMRNLLKDAGFINIIIQDESDWYLAGGDKSE